MPQNQSNDRLNQVLIDLARSLLQYLGDSWLWTSVDALAKRDTIDELVARQRIQVGRLVDLLSSRRQTVDFGLTPLEYGSLHFVSLDFVLEQLIADEHTVLASLEQAIQGCADDPEAAGLLTEILDEERKNVDELGQLSNSQV